MQLTPYEIFVDTIYAYHLDRKFYVSRFSKHLIFTHSSVKSIKNVFCPTYHYYSGHKNKTRSHMPIEYPDLK